jgi:CRP-like cAMP-binding protein
MNLLREVTLTKDQSHVVLKRFCDAIEKMEKDPQQKHVLYKEGDPANYIYIVLKGSFLISKLVIKNATTQQLFDENFNPASIKVKLKAQDIELKPSEMKEKLSLKFERWQLLTLCEKSFIAEDDVMLGSKHMTTAVCTSPTAELLRIPREKFLQLI